MDSLSNLQTEVRHLMARVKAVPLRQMTRQNAEYCLLLAELAKVRARITAVREALSIC